MAAQSILLYKLLITYLERYFISYVFRKVRMSNKIKKEFRIFVMLNL